MPHSASVVQNDNVDVSHAGNRSGAINASDASEFTWPVETEIVLSSQSKKMRLSDQNDLIRWVIHDAMDRVRADLLFRSAYPDRRYLIVIIRTSLLDAASRRVDASSIRRRLLFDEDYVGKIFPLVRSLIIEMTLLILLTDTCPDPAFPR
jgi:hypothetical protein